MFRKAEHLFRLRFSVRYIRTRRATEISDNKIPAVANEDRDEILPTSEKIVSRRPVDILYKSSKSSLDNNDLFEVTELKSESVKSEKPKILLGRHIAESIRASKKTDGSKPRPAYSVKCSDLSRMGQVDFAKLLRKQVIYADENLIVLNKPYGVTAHDGDQFGTDVRSCLPILSKMVYGIETSIPLTLCNRLDKGTTGITVCAANKDLGQEIMKLFRQQKVRRKYWAVTVGTPSPRQGIIDIPMVLRHIDGGKQFRSHTKMGLAPEQKLDYETGNMIDVRQRRPNIAITHYKILDENKGLSLVEFQPLTTVKHQLRVHASEALSCCILGDHKYAQAENLLPQRLPRAVLSEFRLSSTRSRDMPMHLHLREIVIPGILETTVEPNLLVSAKLPEHIYRTIKLFKLKPGPETPFMYPTRLDSSKPSKKNTNPHLEELYIDPFADESKVKKSDVQRDDCYTVYKPRVKVKFQYRDKKDGDTIAK